MCCNMVIFDKIFRINLFLIMYDINNYLYDVNEDFNFVDGFGVSVM